MNIVFLLLFQGNQGAENRHVAPTGSNLASREKSVRLSDGLSLPFTSKQHWSYVTPTVVSMVFWLLLYQSLTPGYWGGSITTKRELAALISLLKTHLKEQI